MDFSFPVQFFVVIAFAALATFFVIAMSIGLVIHKAVGIARSSRGGRITRYYSAIFADLLLRDLPPLPAGSKTSAIFDQYESSIEPIKGELEKLSARKQRLHYEAIHDVLTDYAKDLTGETSQRLIYIFYSFGYVERALEQMESKQWWVRAQAARDLGLLKARKGIVKLTAALEDEHLDVRNQAMQSLMVLVGVDALRTILRLSKNLSQWSEIELSVIIMEFKESAVPFLVEALSSPDQSVVLFSIEMLAQIGFVSAVEPLMKIVQEYPNSYVEAKAAEALGRLGDGRSESTLLALAESRIPHVRTKALEALGRIGSGAAVPLLEQRLRRGERGERVVAARALAGCGKLGVERLNLLSAESDESTRAVAQEALEEAGLEMEVR
ncbi:MAG TPA: hypothetical protein DCP63_13245 [Bacteroidetes bacterium]|nr:hypothetical protein [Bacteroidota bacterium]